MTEINELLAKLKELDPETWKKYDDCWPGGSMTLSFRGEKVYVSKAGETPSMFLCRIIRDRDGEGAQLWSYLCEEMGAALEAGR